MAKDKQEKQDMSRSITIKIIEDKGKHEVNVDIKNISNQDAIVILEGIKHRILHQMDKGGDISSSDMSYVG